MQDIEYGAGIMNRRVFEFVIFKVQVLIDDKHVMNGLSKWNMGRSFEVTEHLRSGFVLVSYFQRNHHKRYFTLQSQNSFKSYRIEIDIKLSCRGDVTSSNCPTHHDDLFYFVLKVGVAEQKYAKISQ